MECWGIGLMSLAKAATKISQTAAKQKTLEVNQEKMEKKLDDVVTVQDAMTDKIGELEAEINGLQQEKLCNNCTIGGIPAQNANNMQFLQLLGDRIGFTAITTRVKRVVCITKSNNQNNQQQTKTLLVEFINSEGKQEFYRKTKLLSPIFPQQLGAGENTRPLVIRDQLTKKSMDIYKEAGRIKGIIGYKYLWIQSGAIWMKKDENSTQIKIRTTDDLQPLLDSHEREKEKKDEQH
jgi:hypothetical protein